eukprot:10165266-Ditylum_brightwellii.AAC.1
MGNVNPSIYVKSKVMQEVWKPPNKIPSAAAFNTAFDAKQEIVLKGGSKAKVYAMLVTKMQFNAIKHHNNVWNFIKAQNVYIKPDQYKRNNADSPGILIK